MRAVDSGFVREAGEVLERRKHLLVRSLKHPPAPHGKQRVPNKRHASILKVECYVPLCVPAHVEHLCDLVPDLDRVALVNRSVDARNLVGLALGPDDGARRCLFELEIPPSVVVVVVRVQDVGQLPPLCLEDLPWERRVRERPRRLPAALCGACGIRCAITRKLATRLPAGSPGGTAAHQVCR